MQIQQEKIDDLNALVRINVSQTDYASKVNKSLKDLSRRVQMKGFREGKVPVSLVKKNAR